MESFKNSFQRCVPLEKRLIGFRNLPHSLPCPSSQFIIGFRKEQVNANLLNGKGEISNVELNCAVLNDTIAKMTPYVELERVHISKLSFVVSSWANLRKAPIVIDIEHVRARAVEPLHYLDRTRRRQIEQILHSELLQMIRDGLLPNKSSGPYNIFDRILDNLTIEIATVHLEYQPMGKFKTRREGPWTPPELQVKLAGIRLASVNEYGVEAPPEEVWRHNHHKHHRGGTFLIYKRLAMEYQILLRPAGEKEGIPLVSGRDNKVEVQFASQLAWVFMRIWGKNISSRMIIFFLPQFSKKKDMAERTVLSMHWHRS